VTAASEDAFDTRRLFALLGGERVLAILEYLDARGPRQTSEIQAHLRASDTNKVVRPLRRMEEFGLVTRLVDEDRHVRTGLTDLGLSLVRRTAGLAAWLEGHRDEIEAARDRFHGIREHSAHRWD